MNTRHPWIRFFNFSDERELRKTVWTIHYSRGDNADEFDNNRHFKKYWKLRRDRSTCLVMINYAQWRLQNRMAKTPRKRIKFNGSRLAGSRCPSARRSCRYAKIADKDGEKSSPGIIDTMQKSSQTKV